MSLPLGIWSAVNQNTAKSIYYCDFVYVVRFAVVLYSSHFTQSFFRWIISKYWPSMRADQMTLQYIGDVAWHSPSHRMYELRFLSRPLDMLELVYWMWFEPITSGPPVQRTPEGIVVIKHAAETGWFRFWLHGNATTCPDWWFDYYWGYFRDSGNGFVHFRKHYIERLQRSYGRFLSHAHPLVCLRPLRARDPRITFD